MVTDIQTDTHKTTTVTLVHVRRGLTSYCGLADLYLCTHQLYLMCSCPNKATIGCECHGLKCVPTTKYYLRGNGEHAQKHTGTTNTKQYHDIQFEGRRISMVVSTGPE